MSVQKKSKTKERLSDSRTGSRLRKADLSHEIQRLGDRVGMLENAQSTLAIYLWAASMSAEIAKMNLKLGRAQKNFRRLANSLIALSCLTLTALLGVVFQGKVSLQPAALVGIFAGFLAFAGYVLHGEADRMGTRDTKG